MSTPVWIISWCTPQSGVVFGAAFDENMEVVHREARSAAELNLIFSIILGWRVGITGVFLRTLFSALLTSAWLDPYLFFHHRLKKPVGPFACRYVSYLVVLALDWGVVHFLCGLVLGSLLWVLAIRLVICAVVGGGRLLAVHFRRREFRNILWELRSMVKKYSALLPGMPE